METLATLVIFVLPSTEIVMRLRWRFESKMVTTMAGHGKLLLGMRQSASIPTLIILIWSKPLYSRLLVTTNAQRTPSHTMACTRASLELRPRYVLYQAINFA